MIAIIQARRTSRLIPKLPSEGLLPFLSPWIVLSWKPVRRHVKPPGLNKYKTYLDTALKLNYVFYHDGQVFSLIFACNGDMRRWKMKVIYTSQNQKINQARPLSS